MQPVSPRSTNSEIADATASSVRGSTTPRLWTPPLRDLDDPDASDGHELIEFADRIGWPLKPWQRWLAVHGCELLPDGRPRFRTVLVIVARQNGKTVKCRVLTLKWMHIDEVELTLGTSTSRDTAKSSWRKVISMAERSPYLAPEYGPKAIRETIGEEAFTTLAGAEYRFAAPNRRAGRSYTVNRAILDELREHQSWDVWRAAVQAMTAVPDAQVWAITNQGDSQSVVLDSLRNEALRYIETGEGDPRLGLFEWSAPAGSDPTDVRALAMANPQLGDTILLDSIIGEAMRAKAAGGEELATFRTEVMCIRQNLMDPAIDEEAWTAAGSDQPLDMAEHRRQVALCLDVAVDGTHGTLVAAVVIDDAVHIEVAQVWNGQDATKRIRAELPDLVAKIKPRGFGWFPNGPAAAIAAALKDRRRTTGRRGPWPPRGVRVAEIVTEQAAVCMGFAEIVVQGEVRHPRDRMLNDHVKHTGKLKRGDTWVFVRSEDHPVDGTYAAAGAAHLARTLPPPLGPVA